MIRTGQPTASSMVFSVAQEFPPTPGFSNSSRVAVTVAERGFQLAIAPSQPGISSGEAKVLASIVSGNSSAQEEAAASGLLASSPK